MGGYYNVNSLVAGRSNLPVDTVMIIMHQEQDIFKQQQKPTKLKCEPFKVNLKSEDTCLECLYCYIGTLTLLKG